MSFAAIEQHLSRIKAAFGKYLRSNAPVMELFPQKVADIFAADSLTSQYNRSHD
jgi:hypothetical protein